MEGQTEFHRQIKVLEKFITTNSGLKEMLRDFSKGKKGHHQSEKNIFKSFTSKSKHTVKVVDGSLAKLA